MSATEALDVLKRQDQLLDEFPFHCRTFCPRVKECNAVLWASIVRSIGATDSAEQNEASGQAEAALGTLQDLSKPAGERCIDGPYYTVPGFMPSGGETACKLNLIDNEYYIG